VERFLRSTPQASALDRRRFSRLVLANDFDHLARRFAPASHRRILLSYRSRHASLGGAERYRPGSLSAHCQRAHLGFLLTCYRRPAVALECDASAEFFWDSAASPLDGRSALNSGRACSRLARRPVRCVFLVRGIVYSSGASLGHPLLLSHFHCWQVSVQLLLAGRLWGIPRFSSRPSPAFVARARLSHPLSARSWPSPPTTGSRALLSHARSTHTYVNPIVAVCSAGFSPAKSSR